MTNPVEHDYTPIAVEAQRITSTNIYVACPFCKSRYNRSGKPAKNSKQIIHIHGNPYNANIKSGDIETRTHHSVAGFDKEYPNKKGEFYIKITNQTIRDF